MAFSTLKHGFDSHWGCEMQNNFDAIIILGHGQKKREVSEVLRNRLNKAFEVFQENGGAKMILSGGRVYSKEFSEAEIMEEFLEKKGVMKEDIILDDKSKSTFENLTNLKKIVEERGFRKIALITSDYHLKRVKMIAKNIGLDIFEFSAFSRKDIRFKKSIIEFLKIIFDYFRIKICA